MFSLRFIKNPKVKQAINAFPFLTSSLDYFVKNELSMAIICLAIAIINLLAIKFIKIHQNIRAIILMGFNSILAILIAFDYLNSGSKYIHIAWFLVALLYVVVISRNYKKLKYGAELSSEKQIEENL